MAILELHRGRSKLILTICNAFSFVTLPCHVRNLDGLHLDGLHLDGMHLDGMHLDDGC